MNFIEKINNTRNEVQTKINNDSRSIQDESNPTHVPELQQLSSTFTKPNKNHQMAWTNHLNFSLHISGKSGADWF